MNHRPVRPLAGIVVIAALAVAAAGPTPARAQGPAPEPLLMLRSLLEDRFKLQAHFETREFPIYELVLARADGRLGPELRQSANDCDALIAGVRAGTPLPPRQPNEPPPCGAMRGPRACSPAACRWISSR